MFDDFLGGQKKTDPEQKKIILDVKDALTYEVAQLDKCIEAWKNVCNKYEALHLEYKEKAENLDVHDKYKQSFELLKQSMRRLKNNAENELDIVYNKKIKYQSELTRYEKLIEAQDDTNEDTSSGLVN